MKTKFLCVIVCSVSCFLTMHIKAFASEEDVEINLPPVVITCSRSCGYGVRRCYESRGTPWSINCYFTGMQKDYCTTAYYV